MFSQRSNSVVTLSEQYFIRTTSDGLKEQLFNRLYNNVDNILDFSDRECDQLYALSNHEFDQYCKILSQRSSLGLAYLSANTAYKNSDRFIMLVNTLAELKNIEIYLSYSEDDKPTDSVQELGEALSKLPIKRLSITVNKGIIHPTFWKYIARCPIESLYLKYSSYGDYKINRFAFLENFLAQHDRVFRGQPQTVQSINILCCQASHSEMKSLSRALKNQGQNLQSLYLGAPVVTLHSMFSSSLNDKFFNSLSTLKSLRVINLDWKGMGMGHTGRTPFAPESFFNALAQCPMLHTLHLMNLHEENAKDYRIQDPISKDSFNLLCNGLKKLKALTTLKIDQTASLEKKTPPELAAKFLNLEQVLHKVGLTEPTVGNIPIRTKMLVSMFGDSYLEYYREYTPDAIFNTTLKASVEENRRRIEAQQHSVQSPLTFSYSNNVETPTNENKPSKMRLKPSGT